VKIYDDLSNDDLIDLILKKGSPTRNVGRETSDAGSMSRPAMTEGPTTEPALQPGGSAAASMRDERKPATYEGLIGPWKLDVIHNAECLTALKQIPTDSLDIAVTSPPYWGQRGNFGLGLEQNPRDYVQNLVFVLAEVMRCLKPSGTLWLNIGDSYNTPINWREGLWLCFR
jgi:hypothetical protein